MILTLLAHVELVFVCHHQSPIRALRVLQIEISEINTFTPPYPAAKYDIESGNKIEGIID
jgi:hypothetical protein